MLNVVVDLLAAIAMRRCCGAAIDLPVAPANAAELYARFNAPHLGQVATARRVVSCGGQDEAQALPRSGERP